MALDPFRTRDHIANFDEIVQELSVRSEATRAALRMTEISYGPDRTETFDLFFPKNMWTRAPVHMFIHGGYWRMFSKRDFSYIADTITAAGAIAASATLCWARILGKCQKRQKRLSGRRGV